MSETQKYLNTLKEIADFDKTNKLNLSENIIIAIINQTGIDYRQNKDKDIDKEKEFIPATEPQKVLLTKLKIKFDKNISKKEADRLIKEYNKNKEQEY